jgi:hypothetical protein
MTERDAYFFALYPGELTPDDRAALDRPGFDVYENGVGMSEPQSRSDEGAASDFSTYQVVRLTAESAEDARQQIIAALGREPDGLRVQQ